MSEALDIYVLDTFAWLTFIEDEAGADRIEELLEKARAGEIVVLVSFMSFMEVYYRLSAGVRTHFIKLPLI
jgi:uncharacterized protein with PIN domain